MWDTMPRKENRRLLLVTGIIALIIVLILIIVIIVQSAKCSGNNEENNPDHKESISITAEPFGELDGETVTRYTLKNKHNVEVKILNYGGIITNIIVPDKDGNMGDIALGFDDITGYKTNPAYFGAIIGRYANRVAKGHFTIDGKTYDLSVNNGENALHGGIRGFDKRSWAAKISGDTLDLRYVSADGEEGYPGELSVHVKYTLTDDNELIIHYIANTTKETIINLTNHSYFNLAGQASGSISDHVARITANDYLPVNNQTIPTGVLAPVEGTAFDLRQPRRLGDVLSTVPGGVGYDHCYCYGKTGWLKNMARVEHPGTGRFIEVSSTEPGMQFYTAFHNDVDGKGGAHYGKFSAFCLETQHYPDSPNQNNFPTTFLSPGEKFRSKTKFMFGVTS